MDLVVSILAIVGLGATGMSSLETSDWSTHMELMPLGLTQIFPQQQDAQVLPVTAQAQIGTALIQLEVAQTAQQQALGLMFRTALPDDRGMLFPFAEPRVAHFWMKNCKIALDMIFIRNGMIKAIQADAPPCNHSFCQTYSSNVVVDQVIELRGGRAQELGVKIGDRIQVQSLSPQS